MRTALRSPRVALLALIFCLAAGELAPVAEATGVSQTAVISPTAAGKVLAYWTPARMQAARPIDGSGSKADPLAAEATISARAVSTPTTYPYSTAGRIFLKTRRGKGFCSGVAVNTPTRRLVLTAGHCLSLREGSARFPEATRYLEFIPAYSNGEAPFGRFVMETGYVLNAWKHTESPNYDFGAVLTYPNALGQNVADATGGGANIALNLPRDEEFMILGYPGFNQQRMRVCEGSFSGHNPFSRGLPGPAQSLAGCFLMPGSSGGPWFVGEPPLLDGLTSETVQLHPYVHYLSSPYFGSANLGALLKGR